MLTRDLSQKSYSELCQMVESYHAYTLGQSNEYTHVYTGDDKRMREMSEKLTHYAHQTKELKNHSLLSIGVATMSVERLKQGELQKSPTLHHQNQNPTQRFVQIYDEGIGSVKGILKEVEDVLTAISNNNYEKSLSTGVWRADIKMLLDHINAIMETFVKTAHHELKTSIELEDFMESLKEISQDLSSSANVQASSLEETAAAIEQITSNIAATAHKAEEMKTFATEAKVAADQGKAIAQAGLTVMSEIFEATKAMHEAMDAIDNIAFQTNILSLNAAVEAATAGDAGRGFAVVAQEVRNLANRSADAAKQIQELARTAWLKAEGGVSTNQNVMDSFAIIATKIAQTDAMVKDVANASREQMTGISQINDAVGQLDSMTQLNASMANNTRDITSHVLELTHDILEQVTHKQFPEKESLLHAHEPKKKDIPHSTPLPKKRVSSQPHVSRASDDSWDSF